jgi:hypothetical protein
MLYKATIKLPYEQVKAYNHLLAHTPNTKDPEAGFVFWNKIIPFSDGSEAEISLMMDSMTGTCVKCKINNGKNCAINSEISYIRFWRDWEFTFGDDRYAIHIVPYAKLGDSTLNLTGDGWWGSVVQSVAESGIEDYRVEGNRVYATTETAARNLTNFANSAIIGCCTCARYDAEKESWYVDLYEGGC